jgi:hypothetical protein
MFCARISLLHLHPLLGQGRRGQSPGFSRHLVRTNRHPKCRESRCPARDRRRTSDWFVPIPPLDPLLANYLAAFGIMSYARQDTLAYVTGYRNVPYYGRQASSIASAAAYLYSQGSLSKSDVMLLFSALHADQGVSIGSKLSIEELQHYYQ